MSDAYPYLVAFVISEAKVVRYLLDPNSVDGAAKAVLMRFGFSPDRSI